MICTINDLLIRGAQRLAAQRRSRLATGTSPWPRSNESRRSPARGGVECSAHNATPYHKRRSPVGALVFLHSAFLAPTALRLSPFGANRASSTKRAALF